jgi:hypothetical protein
MIKELSGYDDIRASVRFYYISTLAKRIPTMLPYIGGRLIFYKQVKVSGSVVLSSVFWENVLIAIAGIFVFVIFLPFYKISIPIGIVVGLITAGCIIAGLLMLRHTLQGVKLFHYIQSRLKGFGLEKYPTYQKIVTWISWYILAWLFAGLSFFCTLHGLVKDIHLTLQDALAISTLATLVALLNLVVPTGLGLKELTIAALLTPWMTISSAIIISLIYRLLHTLNEVLWAGAVLLIQDSSRIYDSIAKT